MFGISNTHYMANYSGINTPKHAYYVYATGTNYLSKTFDSRLEAEISMRKYCKVHNIQLELTEDDKFLIIAKLSLSPPQNLSFP